MDRLTKVIFIFLGACVALILVANLFLERVPVRTYGVKQAIWAGGIEEHDYTTGFHVGITGIHKWHFLDSSTHFLEFVATNREPGSSGRRRLSIFPTSSGAAELDTPVYRRHPALEIRNRDGNVVTIDVSVPYRIRPGEAHKIVIDGLKETYQDRVKATVESVLRGVLPEMSNEALQSTEKRLETATKALTALNGELQQFHVEAEAVLIRQIKFPPEYEEKLQQKQLLAQKALLDQAETTMLGDKLLTGTIEKEITAAESLSTAEWEQKLENLQKTYTLEIAAIEAEALQYSEKTKAEGESTYQEKIAEGQLALDNAEATRDQLRIAALAAAGGEYYLGRLAAENVNISSVLLDASDQRVPAVVDIHELARLFTGQRAPPPVSERSSAAPAEGGKPQGDNK